MAAHSRSASALGGGMSSGAGGAREKTHFEQQREALIGEIAMETRELGEFGPTRALANYYPQSFEHVLANINKLNRSLEAVVAVGNEFSSVEALWSQFENVMAKDEESKGAGGEEQEHQEGGERSTTPKGEPA
ncbi:hypothetical protein NUW58_g8010 [Xylaria curta]|uniref:Uncharacterized protein n=1 Tax=Xylaria curta TaxID=42375 RepID=A0ACC1NCZ3_9PEZI|nr:hypothetical protein NUW58_g8010 [Xylaria curta]